ncbi:hypothetical protein BDK51DRAFT_42526, partial [Blyttiomyces helicus]
MDPQQPQSYYAQQLQQQALLSLQLQRNQQHNQQLQPQQQQQPGFDPYGQQHLQQQQRQPQQTFEPYRQQQLALQQQQQQQLALRLQQQQQQQAQSSQILQTAFDQTNAHSAQTAPSSVYPPAAAVPNSSQYSPYAATSAAAASLQQPTQQQQQQQNSYFLQSSLSQAIPQQQQQQQQQRAFAGASYQPSATPYVAAQPQQRPFDSRDWIAQQAGGNRSALDTPLSYGLAGGSTDPQGAAGITPAMQQQQKQQYLNLKMQYAQQQQILQQQQQLKQQQLKQQHQHLQQNHHPPQHQHSHSQQDFPHQQQQDLSARTHQPDIPYSALTANSLKAPTTPEKPKRKYVRKNAVSTTPTGSNSPSVTPAAAPHATVAATQPAVSAPPFASHLDAAAARPNPSAYLSNLPQTLAKSTAGLPQFAAPPQGAYRGVGGIPGAGGMGATAGVGPPGGAGGLPPPRQQMSPVLGARDGFQRWEGTRGLVAGGRFLDLPPNSPNPPPPPLPTSYYTPQSTYNSPTQAQAQAQAQSVFEALNTPTRRISHPDPASPANRPAAARPDPE